MSTVQDAFAKAGLANHPGYEGFYYHNDPGLSDYAWLRYDPNDAGRGQTGVFVFDDYRWVPVEACPGYSTEDVELLHGQVPNGIPLNDMPLSGFVLDKLPGIVQDIWVGRFASIDHARAEDSE